MRYLILTLFLTIITGIRAGSLWALPDRERNGAAAAEPFTRDTALVGPRETVFIGLVPQHQGIWATICHILEHAEAGIMTTIEVDDQKADPTGSDQP